MIKKIAKFLIISLLIFTVMFIILKIYYPNIISVIVSMSFSLFLFFILLILSLRKSVTVMIDKFIKCPFCGENIETAFINGKLAMSMECPKCGRIIDEKETVIE